MGPLLLLLVRSDRALNYSAVHFTVPPWEGGWPFDHPHLPASIDKSTFHLISALLSLSLYIISGPGRKSRKQLEGCFCIFKLNVPRLLYSWLPGEPLHAGQVFLRNPKGVWLHSRHILCPQRLGSQSLPHCFWGGADSNSVAVSSLRCPKARISLSSHLSHQLGYPILSSVIESLS